MGDGARGFGILLRYWPGFTDRFPVEQLMPLPDDEVQAALDALVNEAFDANLNDCRTRRLAELEARRDLVAKRARQVQVTGLPSSPKERIHLLPADETSLGRAHDLGWATGGSISGSDKPCSPRVWLATTTSADLAQALVDELRELRHRHQANHPLGQQWERLAPRFLTVDLRTLSSSERLRVPASIERLCNGTDTSEWARLAREQFLPVVRSLLPPESNAAPDLTTILRSASKIAGIAMSLGWDFKREWEEAGPVFMAGTPSPTETYRTRIEEYVDSVAELRPQIESPPRGFGNVAATLQEAGKVGQRLRAARGSDVLDLYPELYTLGSNLNDAVSKASIKEPEHDPLGFIDQLSMMPEKHAQGQVGPELGTVGWLRANLSAVDHYGVRIARQEAKASDSTTTEDWRRYYRQTVMEIGRDRDRVRGEILSASGATRLQAFCEASGGEWNSRWLRQQRGRLSESSSIAPAEVDGMTIVDFWEALRRLDAQEPTLAQAWLTRAEDYPDTAGGNLAFIEWVVSEVGDQARAVYDHSRESINLILKSIHVAEAQIRLRLLQTQTDLPPEVFAPVSAALGRELTVDTVERVYKVLLAKVQGLRDAFEDGRREVKSPRGVVPARHKKSTERGEAQAKLIAALTTHHGYYCGSVKVFDPIGCNKLAILADVSNSTASDFFKDQFGSHAKYRYACGTTACLVTSLKLLNQEFSPQLILQATPAASESDEDED